MTVKIIQLLPITHGEYYLALLDDGTIQWLWLDRDCVHGEPIYFTLKPIVRRL
jgi:hypothetical protein